MSGRGKALLAAVLVTGLAAAALASAQPPSGVVHQPGGADQGQMRLGAGLYAANCASCHGPQGEGVAVENNRGVGDISAQGPSLVGVGELAPDFYLRTGRMPLSRPGIEPQRAKPVYSRAQIDDLIAYLTGLDGRGPAIPRVNPAAGDIELGRQLFTDSCSGCHQIVAQGGIAPGLVAPPLDNSTPTEIGEAIRVGPYLMPRFGERQLDAHDVDSIARYVTEVGQHPPNAGGWGIGNVGPIPEGMVAWLLAGTALLLVARVIGERAS